MFFIQLMTTCRRKLAFKGQFCHSSDTFFKVGDYSLQYRNSVLQAQLPEGLIFMGTPKSPKKKDFQHSLIIVFSTSSTCKKLKCDGTEELKFLGSLSLSLSSLAQIYSPRTEKKNSQQQQDEKTAQKRGGKSMEKKSM